MSNDAVERCERYPRIWRDDSKGKRLRACRSAHRLFISRQFHAHCTSAALNNMYIYFLGFISNLSQFLADQLLAG
jgi:hypothetical protein